MSELGVRLRERRLARRLSLEAAAGQARISSAYLHKLEADGVKTPSPHVLRRLGTALDVPYRTLMELAGYLSPEEEEQEMSKTTPTNAEIVRLLEELRKEVAALRRELAKAR